MTCCRMIIEVNKMGNDYSQVGSISHSKRVEIIKRNDAQRSNMLSRFVVFLFFIFIIAGDGDAVRSG